MYRSLPKIIVAGVVLISLLVGTSVLKAQESNEARLQFEQGIRLFKEGDAEGASIAFNRAYELRPSYKILFNIGQVESELKHYCFALAAYRSYLEKGGEKVPEERRVEVGSHIERLGIQVGSVEIKYSKDGTTVLIDEERQGTIPLDGPLCVDMGNHSLSLRKGVEEIYRESFRIAGGQTLVLDLDVEKEEAKEIATEDPPPEPQPAAEPKVAPKDIPDDAEKSNVTNNTAETDVPARGKRRWTFVALGLGGALGIAGGVIGGISKSKESALNGRCPNYICDADESDTKDTIKRMNLSADILFGTAGIAAVAGIVLFFVEPRRTESSKVAIMPIGGPNQTGISLRGRF